MDHKRQLVIPDKIVDRFLSSDKELLDMVNFVREGLRKTCSFDWRKRPSKDLFFRYGIGYESRTAIIWAILEEYLKMKKDEAANSH